MLLSQELRFGPKTPATLDYFVFDWSAYLQAVPGGDTLTAATFAATPTGLTIAPATLKGAQAGTWIGGGVSATTYAITCTITTQAGRTVEQTATLPIL